MKKSLPIIAILLLIALSSNAQYSLMTRGERCPFDSAVAIRLDIYRLESRKMQLGDYLITNLTFQVRAAEELNVSLNKQLVFSNNLLGVKDEMLSAKQGTIDGLLKQMAYKPEKNWWAKNQKPLFFIGGVAVGVGGVALIMHLIN